MADARSIEQMVEVLMNYFRCEQGILRTATAIQQSINRLLGRKPPSRALTGADLAIHYRLLESLYAVEHLASTGGHLPNLVDELQEQLNFRIVVTAGAIETS